MNSYLFSGFGNLTIRASKFTEAHEKLKQKRPTTHGLFGCTKITEINPPVKEEMAERRTNTRWKNKYLGSKRKKV